MARDLCADRLQLCALRCQPFVDSREGRADAQQVLLFHINLPRQLAPPDSVRVPARQRGHASGSIRPSLALQQKTPAQSSQTASDGTLHARLIRCTARTYDRSASSAAALASIAASSSGPSCDSSSCVGCLMYLPHSESEGATPYSVGNEPSHVSGARLC